MHTAHQLPRRPSRASLRIAAAVATVAVVTAVALSSNDLRSPAAESTPAGTPKTPPVQLQLLHAERFQVQQPFQHLWRIDTPPVQSGWLLVVGGDVAPVRQNLEPVLYVGNQTAERINYGTDSNKLVVLVPGDFRLQDAPIFYGDPALPEELRQQDIDAARDAAVQAGALPPTAAAIAAAVAAGGDDRPAYASAFELRLRAIDLVERYSPTEKDLIAGWRVPRVR